ncbi:rod shape-determining protein MreC [bacterium]|nr:rod shape-determining protein MreC [bacterium]
MKNTFTKITELYKEYFVLAVLLLVSTVLIFSNSNQQIAKFRVYTLGIIVSLQEKAIWIPKILNAIDENKKLREENFRLSIELNKLKFAKLENERLRRQLHFVETTNFELISCEVVSKGVLSSVNSIVINAGAKNEVKIDMPIVTENGLVGKIVSVSLDYSLGQLLLDNNFKVGAKVLGANITGILAWKSGNICVLEDIPKSVEVKVGDEVFTSELGTIFPKNIKIGTVTKVEVPETNILQYVDVTTSVDFLRLRNVFLIKSEKNLNQNDLDF